ncbi:MAG: cation-transporting P-type ATPase [Clostridia bacterium]|nr:cation-transporting P-type ATPase [Clostridia bacterium]
MLTGSARAVVTEIGSNCFIVSTEGQIPLLSQRDRLPALSSVEKVCGRVAVLALILILPLILLGVFCTDSLGLMDSFLLAVSFAVSSMGELTAAWGHFIVGRGVRAATRNGENAAVMPHAADISAIASADTVVLFGETALNSGKRSVKAAWRGLSRVSFDSSAKNAGGNEPWACALISAGLPSASSLQRGGGGDRTIDALLSTAANLGVTSDRLRQSVRLIDFAPASPANPFSTALIEENKSLHAICAGELCQLLPRCTRVADASAPGGIGLMRADRSQPLLAAVDAELADGGFAVAYARRSSPCAHLRRISMLQQELTLIGVVIYADPIGEGIRGAADALAERGVRSVLMADAAAEKEGIVASSRAAGILRDGVIARAPEPIPTDAELCLGYDAAARQAFLQGLAERGHSVIGVGTEVADLVSLRACSVAAACTPIHLASEQPVSILSADAYYGSGLLNKNAGLLVRRAEGQGGGLCGIAAACSAAGRILRNLRVAIHYLLASQTVRVSTLVLSLCLGISGILPIHLLVCGLVVDFAAALALAFSREDCRADREVCFRHPVRQSAGWIFIGLVCGLAAALTTALLQIGGVLTQDMTGGFLFLSMVLGQAALLPLCSHASGDGRLSLPIWLYAAGGVLFGLICLLLPAVGSLFAVVSMPLPAMLCLLIAPVVVLFGGEILHTVSLMHLSRENDDAKT